MSLRQRNWEQHPSLYSPRMPPVIMLNTNKYQYQKYHKCQCFSETVFSKKLLQKHQEIQFTVTHNLLNLFFWQKCIWGFGYLCRVSKGLTQTRRHDYKLPARTRRQSRLLNRDNAKSANYGVGVFTFSFTWLQKKKLPVRFYHWLEDQG